MSTPHATSAGQPPAHSHEHHSSHVTPGEISIGVVIGRISEFFDFFVFGLACVLVFPKVIFPFASELDGIFYSFMIFALAFIARPLGSLFFLMLQREFSRGTKLTVALFLLGTTTAGIAFLPGYDSLGTGAIVALAVLRFGQGFAIGGSWDGLASLLALNAPNSRRGWYASIPQLGAPIGFILVAALFAYLLMNLTQQEFFDWGWRYPFFVAFAINVVALFARLRLVVTPEYATLLKLRDLEPSPVGELVRSQGRAIALGAFAPLASYALFHLVTIFALSWALLFTKQSVATFLLVQLVGAAVAIPCMFISGRIADRFGRRMTLAVFGVLIAIYSGWTPVMLNGGTTEGYLFIILGFGLLGFSHAQAAGAVNSSFRTYFRYTGALITSDLGWLIGAGFAPLVALALSVYLGVGYVGLYLLSGAVGTLGALWISRAGGLPNEWPQEEEARAK
ncbi:MULTISPECIES: MFS transporter [Oleiagrimonas]|uniref:MHS family MFS transporter n=1 Tax=Oleiagrimonas citrea TaxID=1665687 RepID=A0A846ZL66_9GAMM|nr:MULTISPECIES: MFS transporter [Oleiagrimonas]NKZ38288.1 MHS family MFS transporter [Oleiagrimonas citrea]RAP58422.1 arabinose ABC transporter permease [Oleiagrimonas sp. MCCC 1A03011]